MSFETVILCSMDINPVVGLVDHTIVELLSSLAVVES